MPQALTARHQESRQMFPNNLSIDDDGTDLHETSRGLKESEGQRSLKSVKSLKSKGGRSSYKSSGVDLESDEENDTKRAEV